MSKEAHLQYFQKKEFAKQYDLSDFNKGEVQLISDCGHWLDAISKGIITPLNIEQETFLQAIRGEKKPESFYEKTWIKYLNQYPDRSKDSSFSKFTYENQVDFVAIDFETANQQRNSACAIGITKVQKGEVVETKHFLIRPEPSYFAPINIKVHGIQPQDVENVPNFVELWHNLRPYLEGQFIIAHNAQFDMSVLRHSLNAYNIDFPSCKYACSVIMARKTLPLRRSGLAFLSEYYGIELNHHNAESDALACAKIVIELCKASSSKSLSELIQNCKYEAGELLSSGEYLPFRKMKKRKYSLR